ncbi:MAG: hypothetical protein ACX932_00005 [Gammaproteobacteria bacterium]
MTGRLPFIGVALTIFFSVVLSIHSEKLERKYREIEYLQSYKHLMETTADNTTNAMFDARAFQAYAREALCVSNYFCGTKEDIKEKNQVNYSLLKTHYPTLRIFGPTVYEQLRAFSRIFGDSENICAQEERAIPNDMTLEKKESMINSKMQQSIYEIEQQIFKLKNSNCRLFSFSC